MVGFVFLDQSTDRAIRAVLDSGHPMENRQRWSWSVAISTNVTWASGHAVGKDRSETFRRRCAATSGGLATCWLGF